jgi:hypothetical protein
MVTRNFLHSWLLSVAVIGLLFLQSCVPAYIPSVVNAPLMSEKGEIVAKVNTGISGFDPQFAYAFTDQLAIMMNGSFRSGQTDDIANYHRHAFGEIGVGYYKPLNETVRFEVFGGGGHGLVNANYSNSFFTPLTDVRYARGFIQPSIGFVTDVIEFSLTPRMIYVYMMQDGLRAGAPFIEPVFTMKLGYKQVKGVFQMGVSWPLLDYDDMKFDYQPFMISFGVQFRMRGLWAGLSKPNTL